MVSRGFGLVVAFILGGCGGGAAPSSKPVGAPPTPTTVTLQQPGGDAADPHVAALERLLSEPWGQRGDKDNQLLVALPDAGNWKRVRYWGVEHFLGFRYGKEHHALVVVFVQEAEEQQPTSEDCLRHFDAWGRPLIKPFDVDFDPFRPHHSKFRAKSLVAVGVDGKLSLGFSRPDLGNSLRMRDLQTLFGPGGVIKVGNCHAWKPLVDGALDVADAPLVFRRNQRVG